MTDFVKYTNFEKLLPILIKYSLVNHAEANRISSMRVLDEQANFFFYTVLPSKGDTAYSMLVRCISEEEEHLGHVSLLQLFHGMSLTEND